MKLNLNGVEPWKGGAILPPGRHTVWIDSIEEGTSSGGHDQWTIQLRATDDSGTITDWMVITENTLGRVAQFLRAADVDVPDGEFDTAPLLVQLAGRKVSIIVREEPDNRDPEKMRSRVVAYDEVAGSDVPADTNGLATASTGNRDDDIPF